MEACGYEHLIALRAGLSNERVRRNEAKTPAERELRTVWVAQRLREIAQEEIFLGGTPGEEVEDMTDDELLEALV